jgi:hypothetical protein
MEECSDIDLLSRMADTSVEDVRARLANDHLAFVAYINDTPASFGWMARGKAFIGELNHELILPIGNRYLWNFRTMEAFRGLGIYPALLQYIMKYENGKADRFWIIHAPENKASLRGIQKAGFKYVGRLYSKEDNACIEATDLSVESRAMLEEMDIQVSAEEPASCWNCSSPWLKKRFAACCCAPSSVLCIGNRLPQLISVQL